MKIDTHSRMLDSESLRKEISQIRQSIRSNEKHLAEVKRYVKHLERMAKASKNKKRRS